MDSTGLVLLVGVGSRHWEKEVTRGTSRKSRRKFQKDESDDWNPGNNGACRSSQSRAMRDVCKRMRGSV